MNAICFEQAFNEHIRICLKLDDLFNQIEHCFQHASLAANRLALESLLHIATLLDRPDFKGKLIKELARIAVIYQRLVHSDKVDQAKLSAMLENLAHFSKQLQFTEGKIGQRLRDNDFLAALRIPLTNPGGICLTDNSAYRLWLNQPHSEQQQDLKTWLSDFRAVQSTITWLLQLIRDSALANSKIAEHGFYQMSLDAQQPLQLLRLHLPKQTRFFPEVSIGRHGVSVRFYPLDIHDKRCLQTDQDVAFKLAICSL